MAGSIFVVQGDITEFQADAVVCSTSTYLEVHGFASAAFARRFPEFESSFQAIQEQHPCRNERGQRLKIGDAFWIPVGKAGERLRGIVLVAVTGGEESIAKRATLSVRNAIRAARDNLQRTTAAEPGDRWLIAVPSIGLGMGGYSRELKTATEVMVRTAAEEIQEPDQSNGVSVEIDVAFVAFTLVNYRLLLDARQALGVEPPCPLKTAPCRELLESIRERRCVLFVGAGLSRGAGLPDWAGLLRELAEDLEINVASLPRDAHGQLSLDLCLDLAQWHADRFDREKLEQRVFEMFGGTGDAAQPVRPTLAHYLLMSMPFRLFLTTNYDDLLERTLTALRRDPEVVCTPAEVFRTGQVERPSVVKLHGDAARRTRIVLTRDDFDNFFRDYPVTAALLQGLLLNHTFLFVGYDLRDPNTRQVYSSVAHLLNEAGTRAYSINVRDEDVTSKFYEDQWSRQGLITLRMPGPDRIRNSLMYFDWLARQVCELKSFLHPGLRTEELPGEMQDLEPLRNLLFQVSEQLMHLLKPANRVLDSPNRTRVVATLLDLVTKLGWKPPGHGIWEELAEMVHNPLEKRHFLGRALSAAESVAELDRTGARLKEVSEQQQPHGASGAGDNEA